MWNVEDILSKYNTNIRRCIEKFLTYYRSQQNVIVKEFIIKQHTLLVIEYIYYKELNKEFEH